MSLYDVLKVRKRATKAEIKRSYLLLIKIHHPGVNKYGVEEFLKINSAYKILEDEYKRGFYDIFGDTSIDLLHNEDSYILTRLFDKFNVYLYIAAFVVFLVALFALPFLVASERYNCVQMVSPFGIAVVIMVVPAIRSLFILDASGRKSFELRSIILCAVEMLVTAGQMFNCTLYLDGYVDSLWTSLAICLAAEICFLVLSLCHKSSIRINSEGFTACDVKNMLMRILSRGLIFTMLLIFSSEHFNSSCMRPALFHLAAICYIRKRTLFLSLCLLILQTFYTITFILILRRCKMLSCYIPLVILIVFISVGIGCVVWQLFKNIPRSEYDKRKYPALLPGEKQCV